MSRMKLFESLSWIVKYLQKGILLTYVGVPCELLVYSRNAKLGWEIPGAHGPKNFAQPNKRVLPNGGINFVESRGGGGLR